MHRFNELLAIVLHRGGAFHEEETWDYVEEDPPHPVRHRVGARGAMVHVEHKDGDDDGQGDKDHGEEQVLPNQGDDQGGRRDDLRDEQQEHSEGQQHGDAQSYLFSTLRGQVEDQDSQAGDKQAGDDQVDCVEEWQPPDNEGVSYIGVDLCAAFIFLAVVIAHSINDDPFPTLPVVQLVHMAMHAHQVYLGFVIRPGAKFHCTVLLVKGEEGNIDAAGAFVDSRWHPFNSPIVEEVSLGQVGDRKVTISTGEREKKKRDYSCLGLLSSKEIEYLVLGFQNCTQGTWEMQDVHHALTLDPSTLPSAF